MLPPTVREVRGPAADEFTEPRPQAAVATQQQDVLLIPRWVYVPYSPHVPVGQIKLPGGTGNVAAGQYTQVDEGITVLPPMGAAPIANSQNETLEQCLQQMKVLNARIGELEAKNASRPASFVPPPTAPQMLPLPPVPAKMIPPAK